MGEGAAKQHNAALDGLRAIAVLLVMVFHARVGPVSVGGFVGVDLFFVLSGYLITGNLARELAGTGNIRVGRFYLRRILRLAPALLLYVAVYAAVAPMIWPEYGSANHFRDVAFAAFYLSDFTVAFWNAPLHLGHSWSLAVEEHFYLLWPLLLPAILRRRDPARVLLVIYMVAAVWRCANLMYDWNLGYYRFDSRIAGILLGCWLAVAVRDKPVPTALREWPAGVLALLILAVIALTVEWTSLAAQTVAMPLAELAAVLLILNATTATPGPVARMLSVRPAVWLGTLSYGMYLWHYPLARDLRHEFDLLGPGLTIAIAVPLAWVSWHTVERLGRMAREWFDQRERAVKTLEPVA